MRQYTISLIPLSYSTDQSITNVKSIYLVLYYTQLDLVPSKCIIKIEFLTCFIYLFVIWMLLNPRILPAFTSFDYYGTHGTSLGEGRLRTLPAMYLRCKAHYKETGGVFLNYIYQGFILSSLKMQTSLHTQGGLLLYISTRMCQYIAVTIETYYRDNMEPKWLLIMDATLTFNMKCKAHVGRFHITYDHQLLFRWLSVTEISI